MFILFRLFDLFESVEFVLKLYCVFERFICRL